MTQASTANLDLYVERALGLARLIQDALDSGEPTPMTRMQADALLTAVGRILRHRDAAHAQGEPFFSTSELILRTSATVASVCTLAWVRTATDSIAELRSQATQLPGLPRGPEDTGDPLAWPDSDAVAARIETLLDADDTLSALYVMHLFRATPLADVQRAALLVGRRLLINLNAPSTAAVVEEVTSWVDEREGWFDPVGRFLWLPAVEPDMLAELTAEAMQSMDKSAHQAPVHQPANDSAFERMLAPLAAASPSPDKHQHASMQVPLWDYNKGTGVLCTLSIGRPTDGVPGTIDTKLLHEARRGIRNGYLAAGRLLPSGAAPYPLTAHSIRVDQDQPIDGHSIGLAALLLFYAVWTEQELDPQLAATGIIGVDGEHVHSVDPAYLPAKLSACVGRPVLIPKQSSVDVGPHLVLAVGTQRNALLAAGLQPNASVPTPSLDQRSRTRALQHVLDAIEAQDLSGVDAPQGVEPWSILADSAIRWIQALEPSLEPDAPELLQARLLASTAYMHAGDLLSSREARGGRLIPDSAPLALQAADLTDKLAHAIDARTDAAALLDALADVPLDSLPPAMRCQVLGTTGRWHLHQRAPRTALPLLRQSVESAPAWEQGRSLIYVSMALRTSGDADDALAALTQADTLLATQTRRYSRAYESSTRMFLAHERGRVLNALCRHREALDEVTPQLASPARGWWPRAGLLRVAAHAYRGLGDAEELARALESLDGLCVAAGSNVEVLEGVLEDARGGQASVY